MFPQSPDFVPRRKKRKIIPLSEVTSVVQWQRIFENRRRTLLEKAKELEVATGCQVTVAVSTRKKSWFYATVNGLEKHLLQSGILNKNYERIRREDIFCDIVAGSSDCQLGGGMNVTDDSKFSLFDDAGAAGPETSEGAQLQREKESATIATENTHPDATGGSNLTQNICDGLPQTKATNRNNSQAMSRNTKAKLKSANDTGSAAASMPHGDAGTSGPCRRSSRVVNRERPGPGNKRRPARKTACKYSPVNVSSTETTTNEPHGTASGGVRVKRPSPVSRPLHIPRYHHIFFTDEDLEKDVAKIRASRRASSELPKANPVPAPRPLSDSSSSVSSDSDSSDDDSSDSSSSSSESDDDEVDFPENSNQTHTKITTIHESEDETEKAISSKKQGQGQLGRQLKEKKVSPLKSAKPSDVPEKKVDVNKKKNTKKSGENGANGKAKSINGSDGLEKKVDADMRETFSKSGNKKASGKESEKKEANEKAKSTNGSDGLEGKVDADIRDGNKEASSKKLGKKKANEKTKSANGSDGLKKKVDADIQDTFTKSENKEAISKRKFPKDTDSPKKVSADKKYMANKPAEKKANGKEKNDKLLQKGQLRPTGVKSSQYKSSSARPVQGKPLADPKGKKADKLSSKVVKGEACVSSCKKNINSKSPGGKTSAHEGEKADNTKTNECSITRTEKKVSRPKATAENEQTNKNRSSADTVHDKSVKVGLGASTKQKSSDGAPNPKRSKKTMAGVGVAKSTGSAKTKMTAQNQRAPKHTVYSAEPPVCEKREPNTQPHIMIKQEGNPYEWLPNKTAKGRKRVHSPASNSPIPNKRQSDGAEDSNPNPNASRRCRSESRNMPKYVRFNKTDLNARPCQLQNRKGLFAEQRPSSAERLKLLADYRPKQTHDFHFASRNRQFDQENEHLFQKHPGGRFHFDHITASRKWPYDNHKSHKHDSHNCCHSPEFNSGTPKTYSYCGHSTATNSAQRHFSSFQHNELTDPSTRLVAGRHTETRRWSGNARVTERNSSWHGRPDDTSYGKIQCNMPRRSPGGRRYQGTEVTIWPKENKRHMHVDKQNRRRTYPSQLKPLGR